MLGGVQSVDSQAMLDGTVVVGGGRVRSAEVQELVRALLGHGQMQDFDPRSYVRYADRKKANLRYNQPQSDGERRESAENGSRRNCSAFRNTKFGVGGNSVSTNGGI
jgi:hypothetical protein